MKKLLTFRETQLAELGILAEFDRIWKENNLVYTLAYGTLLGAVRHKGFIPWDDDIDVCMPRPDYEKFIKIFAEKADTKRFSLTHDRGDGAMYPFLKMTDNTVKLEERHLFGVDSLWIDIFAIDGVPDDEKKIKKIVKKAMLLRKIIKVNKWKRTKDYNGRYSKLKFFLARIYARLYGEKRALKNALALATRYTFDCSDKVCGIAWCEKGMRETMTRAGFENMTELEFEGRKFPVISDYDENLTLQFGDYMTPPPENEREGHGVKAYIEE